MKLYGVYEGTSGQGYLIEFEPSNIDSVELRMDNSRGWRCLYILGATAEEARAAWAKHCAERISIARRNLECYENATLEDENSDAMKE